jgi:hypothetical protein
LSGTWAKQLHSLIWLIFTKRGGLVVGLRGLSRPGRNSRILAPEPTNHQCWHRSAAVCTEKLVD